MPSRAFSGFYRALQPVVGALTGDRVQLEVGEAEALGNLLLLLPAGFLLPLAVPGIALTLVLGGAALASLTVEYVQSRYLAERSPTLQDVLLNVGGAAVGLVLAADLVRWRGRAR